MRVHASSLRHHRLRQALTQKELATAAGVSYVTISRMENSVGGPVKPTTLRKLSTALGLKPDTLIEWDSPQEEDEANELAG